MGAWGVKKFSVGICDDTPSTAGSSFYVVIINYFYCFDIWKYITFFYYAILNTIVSIPKYKVSYSNHSMSVMHH